MSYNDAQIELVGEVEESERISILKNVSNILSMMYGTCPMNRNMGISGVIGSSVIQAQGNFTMQAMEQVELYEPRATVKEIIFDNTEQQNIPKVVLSYGK